jgi:hypothetical protein
MMDITNEVARSRACQLAGVILRRYLASGVIETELISEAPAIATMVKAELFKLQGELSANDLHAKLPCHSQPFGRGSSQPRQRRRQNAPRPGQASPATSAA